MKKLLLIQYVLPIILLFVIVWFWEFFLEDFLTPGHESTAEHWEYIFHVVAFGMIALILPTIISMKEWVGSKQLEEKLHLLSSISNQSISSVITTNTKFEINWINLAFKKLYGYKEEEIIGQTPAFLNADNLSEEIQKDIYQAVSKGKTWHGTISNKRKNGDVFWCDLEITPLFNSSGEIIAYSGQQKDITKLKQANDEREKLIIELQNALSEIKTLRGIIPICMYCHKIKADIGDWNKLETYIEEHSDADFTHGICPDCLAKQMEEVKRIKQV